jgi:hypothetical protein
MALLDVSEAVDDPDFTDTLICVRETRVAGDDGEVDEFFTSTVEIEFTGVIQDPGASDPLINALGGTYVAGNMVVFTKFRLSDGSAEGETAADHVLFNGSDYLVKSISDWSNFGEGYLVAGLVAQALNP